MIFKHVGYLLTFSLMLSLAYADSIDQKTEGWCSPAVNKTDGNVTINCYGTSSKIEKNKDALTKKPLLSVDQLRKTDINILEFLHKESNKLTHKLSLSGANIMAHEVLKKSNYFVSVDGGEFVLVTKANSSNSSYESAMIVNYSFMQEKPASKVAIKVQGNDNKVVGPFEFDVGYKALYDKLKIAEQKHKKKAVQRDIERYRIQLIEKKGIHCAKFANGLSRCNLLDSRRYGKILESSVVKAVHFGDIPNDLYIKATLSGSESHKIIARQKDYKWLVGIPLHKLSAMIEFSDGTKSPVFSYVKERKYGTPTKSDTRGGFQITSSYRNAPVVIAHTNSYLLNKAKWGFTPIVGTNVRSIHWTTYEGGKKILATKDGIFTAREATLDNYGVTDHSSDENNPTINITYTYNDGIVQTFSYQTQWHTWAQHLAVEEVNHNDAIWCGVPRGLDGHGRFGLFDGDFNILFPVACGNNFPNKKLGSVYKELYWGTSSTNLTLLTNNLNKESILKKHISLRVKQIEKQSNEYNRNRIQLETEKYNKELEHALTEYPYNWKNIDRRSKPLLLLTEPHDFLYFQFVDINGDKSQVIQVRVTPANFR